MDELILRSPTDDDLDAILELVRLGLGEGSVPRAREFWTWKHLASPFGRSYLLVAEARGRIVGLRAFLRWTWWSGERAVPAVRAVDTVTHPEWQGRGIFTRLTLGMIERMETEGVAFVFNTPNDRSRPGYLKMGWVVVGRLTPWVRVLPSRLFRRGVTGSKVAEGHSSVRDLLGAPGLDALLEAAHAAADDRLVTRVDPGYLGWRYADAPGLSYHGAWRFGEGDGAAVVFRIVERAGRVELRLCEVLAAPTSRSIRWARSLIESSARRAGADRVTALAASGTTERRVVAGGGFLPLPRLGPVLTVRPIHPAAAPVDPRRRRSWRPSAGAMELF